MPAVELVYLWYIIISREYTREFIDLHIVSKSRKVAENKFSEREELFCRFSFRENIT